MQQQVEVERSCTSHTSEKTQLPPCSSPTVTATGGGSGSAFLVVPPSRYPSQKSWSSVGSPMSSGRGDFRVSRDAGGSEMGLREADLESSSVEEKKQQQLQQQYGFRERIKHFTWTWFTVCVCRHSLTVHHLRI